MVEITISFLFHFSYYIGCLRQRVNEFLSPTYQSISTKVTWQFLKGGDHSTPFCVYLTVYCIAVISVFILTLVLVIPIVWHLIYTHNYSDGDFMGKSVKN